MRRRRKRTDRFGVKRLSSLIGRKEEASGLRRAIDGVVGGNGGTVLIKGEAGIGKSRLISEMQGYGEEKGVRMLVGRGLEGGSPYMPFVNALKDVGPDLMSPGELSMIEEVFLLNEKGYLISHVARTLRPESEDMTLGRLFATIKDFMGRSFEDGDGRGSLDELQYGNFKILFDSAPPLYLAVVVSGGVSHDLKREMGNLLRKLERGFGNIIREWKPGEKVPGDLEKELSAFSSMEFRTSRRIEGLDPKKERDRMFDGVLDLLMAISRVRPVILALDDLQWFDDSSLDLLHYISRNIGGSPILLLGAYRPEEGIDPESGAPARLTETLRRMRREKLFEEIELHRLTREDTESMMRDIFKNNDFPDELYDRLYKETEGNPFFVEEIVENLMREGTIFQGKTGLWHVKGDMEIVLPSTVKDVVMRRMDRLDEGYRKIIETAAVIGTEFNIDLLLRILGTDEEDLLLALDDLDEMNLIREIPGGEAYAFDHGMIREVIIKSMSRNLRRVMHRKISVVLEEMFPSDPGGLVYDLARHYGRTKEDLKAFYYSVRAARRASRLCALRETVYHYERALERVPKLQDVDNIIALEVGLRNDVAVACYYMGDWECTKRHTDRVLEVAPGAELFTELAQAYRIKGMMEINRGEWEEAILDQEAAIEICEKIGDTKGKLEGLHQLGDIYFKSGRYERSLELLNSAINGADRKGYRLLMAKGLITKGNVLNVRNDFEKAVELYKRGLRLAKATDNIFEVTRAYNNLGDLYLNHGELDVAERYFRRTLETAQSTGEKIMIGFSYSNLGVVSIKREEPERARTYCTRALEIFTQMDEKSMMAAVYMDFGSIHMLEENWAEAAVCFDIAIDALETLGRLHTLGEAHKQYGSMLVQKGDKVGAMTHLERAVEIFEECDASVSAKDVKRELERLRKGDEHFKVEMVGRDGILEELADAMEVGLGLKEMETDTGRMVILEGGIGMGKSRIMERILKMARAREGITTLEGECLRGEMSTPFYPFIRALNDLFRGKDRGSLERFLRTVPLDLLSIFPGLDPKTGSGDGGGGRTETVLDVRTGETDLEEKQGPDIGARKDRMFEGMSRLFLETGEPMGLFIEDLHFADASSLQLLSYMARELKGTRTFILATYSPEGIGPSSPLVRVLEEMEGIPVVKRLKLQALDKEGVRELARRFAGIQEIPDQIVERLMEWTKGNPMFVEEILKSIPDEAKAKGSLEGLGKERIPGSLIELLRDKISTLSPGEREVLEYASVSISGFAAGLLFDAMGIGREALETGDQTEVLDELVKKGLLVEEREDEMHFHHPILQQAVYEGIPLDKRRKIHRAMGRALERQATERFDEVIFDLAHHYSRAGSSDKAFRFTILAGHRAMAMSAMREAEAYFRDAIRIADTMRASVEDHTVLSAGEVLSARHHLHKSLLAQGRMDEALEVARITLSMARDIGDVVRESQALMDIGNVGRIRSQWEDAKASYDLARRLCQEVGFKRGLFRANKGLSWICWRRNLFQEAFEHARRCIEIGEELDDKYLIALGYTELGSALGEKGDFERAIQNLSRAKTIFEAGGDRYELARVLNNIGVSYRDKGDPAGARANFERCIRISEELGIVRMIGYALSNMSECYIMEDALDRAEEGCERSISIFQKVDEPYMVSSSYRRMAMIERLRGDFVKAEDYIKKGMGVTDVSESPLHEAEMLLEKGLLMRDMGNLELARECIGRAKEIFSSVGNVLGEERAGEALGDVSEEGDMAHE